VCPCVYKWKLYKGCANDKSKGSSRLLIDFTDDVGIPETLVMDGATQVTGKHTDDMKSIDLKLLTVVCRRSQLH
jgi:hypothetical protein